MKKNNLVKYFFATVIKVCFVIILVVFTGIISYKATMQYYTVHEVSTTDKTTTKVVKDIVSDAKVENISKNLIYGVDQETEKINKMVLEILNTNTGNLDYITIPQNTTYTMSDTMYRRICIANPSIPQIIQFSELNQYFKDTLLYEYGSLLVGDMLNIEVSYYTTMYDTSFQLYFQEEEKNIIYTEEEEVNELVEIQKFSQPWKKQIKQIKTEEEIEQLIEDCSATTQSNLSMQQKLKYIDNYKNINLDYIYFYTLYGIQEENKFSINTKQSQQLLEEIIQADTHTIEQKTLEEKEHNSSKKYKIQILNGSKISKLAASYQEKLKQEGYDIVQIGNYNEAVLQKTKVIVTKEGMGIDLLPYFHSDGIEVNSLPDGIDICIILGTEDRLQ